MPDPPDGTAHGTSHGTSHAGSHGTPHAAAGGFASFEAFWPHYLREHARPATRLVHAAGTAAGLALLVAGVAAGPWWLVPLALVAGYGAAWGSHLLLERNRPATFRHPLWSLRGDLRMAWLMATGRLGPELQRAGLS